MNWGWKITIVYLLFAGGIMTLVMKSKAHKVDLVVPDYYKQELAYETRLNAMRNAETLSEKPSGTLEGGQLRIVFPAEITPATTSGTIVLYRPSDVNDDQNIPISLSEDRVQYISTDGMKKGLYLLQMSWKTDQKDYYTEQTFFLN